MANTNLANAKTAKNDEFYTQYPDIQKEINAYLDYDPNVFRGKTVLLPCDDPEWSNFTKFFAQNFELLGLKKLISTSYAPESKKYKIPYQPTLFETEQPHFNADKSKTHGKIFVLERDVTGDNRINIEDLQWQYLEGDGDFRSKEIRKLRDEADIIVTNTAKFSLYVSPYLVANQGGRYTKHIYIGSQRIVSKLGDLDSYGSDPRRIPYAGSEADAVSIDYKTKYASQQQVIKDNYAAFDVPYNGEDNNDYVDGEGFCCNDGSMEAAQARALARAKASNFQDGDAYEKMQFYYHPDHLGSSSYITDLDGEVVQHIEYVPFGEVFIEERNNTWNTPYLFNAKEFDKETGLYYYGARYYEPRLSLWISVDKSAIIAPGYSPYIFCENNPNIMVDSNGDFPIFINGRVSDDSERGSASYWNKGLREIVKQKTGYYHSQFKFVDGDKGVWPSTRYKAGIAQGKADAAAIYAVLKSSAKDGVISEQLQIISHSRGSAFASGYMQSVSAEIRNLANKDNLTFSYGNDNIVEYSINIGPHQSNYISYEESGTVNVNISHFGDILSGNDATGNVINIHSCMAGWEQHGNATFIPELEFVLPVLEAGGSKSEIKKQLTYLYQQWNKKHPEQIKSTVE